MSKIGKPEKMIIDGKRLDGRGLEEFRPLTAEIGVLKRANGSAVFRFGDTYALSGVFGPKTMHPRHLQDPQRAFLKCRYSMAPFSTKERIRPGRSRRGTEISKVLNEALSNVIFFEDYPKTGIDVFVKILQANASTRCAGLNAASLALAEAGVSMRNLISACTVGKVDGQIVLDVGGDEDQFGDVDVAFATIGNKDKIVLFQMDGIVTKEEFLKIIDLAKNGCAQVFEKQVNALREKYKTGEENVENE
ncbi:MAG: exosome complex exonuclease Rrp41 [Candidatus Aenigmarchaeota archaeon]|nr:exosome complex exonuclease Rrp41 [Candidatus Aenigmarchaeota archaeon]